ncbi:hypothetical protein EDB85DRAFT_1896561 [Lactarius pseudohatsudake]|nr:hypothetical protein EDB85DRAFT_1896561 [Lactarius pseudohatsudake]
MGSRTGHNDIDTATRAPVPKASERSSPLCDSVMAVGGGRPKVIRGRRRKRHGETLQRPSPHSQDSMKKRLATPALPRVPLLQPDIRSGAKSGLTVTRRRVLMVAHYGQQDQPQ